MSRWENCEERKRRRSNIVFLFFLDGPRKNMGRKRGKVLEIVGAEKASSSSPFSLPHTNDKSDFFLIARFVR